jgi:rhodanese-related sulfurtransferase
MLFDSRRPCGGATSSAFARQPGGAKQPKQQTKTTMKKLLALLTTAFVAVSAQAGEFPDISVDELKSAIEAKKVTVIDVNGSASYKAGHIPGAIDFRAQKADIAKLLPSDKSALVVAYCGGPTCNAYSAAAKAAKELGYTNVKHLSAGISGWKAANAPLEKAK